MTIAIPIEHTKCIIGDIQPTRFVSEIVKYVVFVNKNATLTSDLETLKQDSNYLREHFDILRNDEYYSVYIDGDYQYVDSKDDSISIIK